MQDKNHRLLQTALEILSYVADNGEPVSFKMITGQFALPKSTVHNLVQTMSSLQYLEKDGDNGKYSIGIRCFQSGNAYRKMRPFRVNAGIIVEKLSRSCNETTHFAILQNTDVIYIYKFDSTHSIRIHSEVGKRVPAHATAIGKALLAGYSDSEVRALYPGGELPALTARSITSVEVLIEQLREIRRTSVAYEFEESSPYVKCIAVPIMSSGSSPIAGLSLALPIYREETNTQHLIDLLLETKGRLEELYALYE